MPRRKPRVNITPGPTGKRIVLDKSERAKIEAAYNCQLSDQVWNQIKEATDEFAVYEPTLKRAAPLSKAIGKLHRVADAARSLRCFLLPKSIDADNLNLQDLWYLGFRPSVFREGPPDDSELFEFVLAMLEPIIAISNFVKKCGKENSLSEFSTSDELIYWNFWVCALTIIFAEHGLSWAARKDFAKRKHDAASLFVAFVYELQQRLPKEYQKFMHSPDALAQAIYRARLAGGLDERKLKSLAANDLPKRRGGK
jgi:hypothetical protein